MTASLTQTSTLEAVNQMLFAIGEAPVNAVEDTGLVDTSVALRTLQNVSREVQKDGWHWNTEEGYVLATSDEGFLWLPPNALKVDTTGVDAGLDLVQRGNRLYDRVNHTYVFTKSVTVDMVVLLDFEECPEAARNYITLKAARRFQQNMVGSVELSGFQQQDELRALVALQNAEAESADYNMMNNSDVARVLAR